MVDTLYEGDHRRAVIEHPRVRFDGVYIAVCHCKFRIFARTSRS